MINTILIGDVIQKLKEIPDQVINTCVTSPPYWGLRDYNLPPIEWPDGWVGCLGLESTPEMYVSHIVMVFRKVWQVLRDDGTLWLNLGDTYAANRGYQVPDSKHVDVGNSISMKASDFNLKPKDLVGIPWMVAFALRSDGWYLRQDIIWHKPNPMPESVKDRCTKAHEYIFLLSKSQKYYYDYKAIKEPASYNTNERVARSKIGQKSIPTERHNGIRPRKVPAGWDTSKRSHGTIHKNGRNRETKIHGNLPGRDDKGKACNSPDQIIRNKRSVWIVSTKPFPGAHFATFPPDLIEPCILAGSPRDGIVLDPFFGTGTTGIVSLKNGRKYIGIELNSEYAEMAENRIKYGTVDPEEIEAEKKQGNLFGDDS